MFGIFFAAAILVALFQVLIKKRNVTERFLKYLLVIACGLSGIYAFVGHYFLSDMVAESIGWAAGNPFQLEVGFANLSFGVLGVLCVWKNTGFRISTAIGYSIFLLGAAVVHINDISANDNLESGNAGMILYFDILVPLTLFGLSFIEWRKLKTI